MSEEILINKNDAVEVLGEMQGHCTTKAALVQNSKIWHQIKDLPSIKIVRCKDRIDFLNNHMCLHWSRFGSVDVKLDDYCSYGETYETQRNSKKLQ